MVGVDVLDLKLIQIRCQPSTERERERKIERELVSRHSQTLT